MDELDLLKKQWQSSEQDLPRLSYDDIYKMILKKSSSIVKWIFYISIAELIFWTILAFFVPESSEKVNEGLGIADVLVVINLLNYVVFVFFIVLFYKNYRKIKVTDTIKELMQNILRTRKTVKYFVIYNVGTTALLIFGVNIFYYTHQNLLYKIIVESYPTYKSLTPEKFGTVFFITQFILGIILLGLVVLFYRLVYGILLKRLKKNYGELKKIEI